MIVTVEEAKKLRCPEGVAECCLATGCIAWEFWVKEGIAYKDKPAHGIPAEKKRGYCGKVIRRQI